MSSSSDTRQYCKAMCDMLWGQTWAKTSGLNRKAISCRPHECSVDFEKNSAGSTQKRKIRISTTLLQEIECPRAMKKTDCMDSSNSVIASLSQAESGAALKSKTNFTTKPTKSTLASKLEKTIDHFTGTAPEKRKENRDLAQLVSECVKACTPRCSGHERFKSSICDEEIRQYLCSILSKLNPDFDEIIISGQAAVEKDEKNVIGEESPGQKDLGHPTVVTASNSNEHFTPDDRTFESSIGLQTTSHNARDFTAAKQCENDPTNVQIDPIFPIDADSLLYPVTENTQIETGSNHRVVEQTSQINNMLQIDPLKGLDERIHKEGDENSLETPAKNVCVQLFLQNRKSEASEKCFISKLENGDNNGCVKVRGQNIEIQSNFQAKRSFIQEKKEETAESNQKPNIVQSKPRPIFKARVTAAREAYDCLQARSSQKLSKDVSSRREAHQTDAQGLNSRSAGAGMQQERILKGHRPLLKRCTSLMTRLSSSLVCLRSELTNSFITVAANFFLDFRQMQQPRNG